MTPDVLVYLQQSRWRVLYFLHKQSFATDALTVDFQSLDPLAFVRSEPTLLALHCQACLSVRTASYRLHYTPVQMVLLCGQ
jgi:hypothetical protein